MAWTDRLRQAAYTSPSGTRYPFVYEDVGYSRTKNTTEFVFPDAVGTYVQESGSSGRTYPMQCIFWGENCDQQADAFDAALFERGTGKLDHPMYGTVDVVPTGTITRRDDLKSSANQVVIEVTFVATIGLIYPSSQNDPASQILASVSDFNLAQNVEFQEYAGYSANIFKADFQGRYTSLLGQSASGLQDTLKADSAALAKFNVIKDSITRGLGSASSDVGTLAQQTAILLQVPAEITSIEVTSQINAFSKLIRSLAQGISGTLLAFDTTNLFASSYVIGAALSATYGTFDTRPSAISAALGILDLFDVVNSWKDLNLQFSGAVDSGGTYQQLQKTVALTAGYLVEISFTAKQERKIILDRARTVIDLTAQLYGSLQDADIDYFISTNNLSGTEILELPRGREVVYYV